MKILIADDERLIRVNLISMIQELYGYAHTIEEAKDGSELQKKLDHNTYDLVFVDINMPRKNGLDVMEGYKTKNKNVTWCVLSGYADFEYAKRAISLGVKEYLLKPVDIDDLHRLIEVVIRENETRKRKEHLLYEKKINQAFVLADSLGVIQPLKLADNKKEYCLYVFFWMHPIILKDSRFMESYIGIYLHICKNILIRTTVLLCLFYRQENYVC